MKFYKRLISGVLCISLTMLFIPYNIKAEEIKKQEIHIYTEEDFIEFSKKAAVEGYSKNTAVYLEEDLDFSDKNFEAIPIFWGDFYGQGHQIEGVTINKNGSKLGVFRIVEKNASINDLIIKGDITPGGSKSCVGGIAGINKGIIKNSVFKGEIKGDTCVGGIAGINDVDAKIEECINYAEIFGNIKAGGIVGNNKGEIISCQNKNEVNTKIIEIEVEKKEEESIMTLDKIYEMSQDKGMDSGGIAGFSSGNIIDSQNHADIGYEGIGFYIGGIVGRGNGVINRCKNFGNIRGKKSVGGIAGQLEPYLFIKYEQDIFGEIGNISSSTNDNKNKLKDHVSNTIDNTSLELDRAEDILRDIDKYTDRFRDNNADRENYQNSIEREIDNIEALINSIDFTLVNEETTKQIEDVKKDISELKELIKSIKEINRSKISIENLKKEYDSVLKIIDILKNLPFKIESIMNKGYASINAGRDDFQNDLSNIKFSTTSLIDILGDYEKYLSKEIKDMDMDINTSIHELSRSLGRARENIKVGRKEITSDIDRIEEDFNMVSDKAQDNIEYIEEERDKLSQDEVEFFNDISAEIQNIENLKNALIKSSANMGRVKADNKAGGIVGAVGIDTYVDKERKIDRENSKSTISYKKAYAIVNDCKNEADIEVRDDFAGGIVGKGSLGVLEGNYNFADISSEYGSYIGGIAGSAKAIIRNSYSMSNINGKSYMGGIAGYAFILENNMAMSDISLADGEYVGSIAGFLEKLDKSYGNIYVSDSIGAIDGITYDNIAEVKSYEDFIKIENIPNEFRNLNVEFISEDQVIKRISVFYGASLEGMEMPKVPQKKGFYGEWDKKELKDIKTNIKVNAIYTQRKNSISSSDEALPELIVQGEFSPDAKLVLFKDEEADIILPKPYRLVKKYKCIIENNDLKAQGKLILRLKADDFPKKVGVVQIDKENISFLDTYEDGSYLVFEIFENTEFAVVERSYDFNIYVFIACFLIIIIFVFYRYQNELRRILSKYRK